MNILTSHNRLNARFVNEHTASDNQKRVVKKVEITKIINYGEPFRV